MTNGRRVPAMIRLGLIAAAAALALLPASAAADAVSDFCGANPTGDSDGDGFPNAWECAMSQNYPGSGDGSISLCSGSETAAQRQNCYDPRTPDVYVIKQVAACGTLGAVSDLFDPLIKPVASGGLGWAAVHPIALNQTGTSPTPQCVKCDSPTQGAAKLAESCDVNDSPTGVFIGSIDRGGTAIIYTERMKARLTSAGVSASAFMTELHKWVRHTTCQELQHGAGNRNPLDRRTGDNHYSAGSNVCLDSDVVCKRGVCTIGLTNTDADRTGWDLDVQ